MSFINKTNKITKIIHIDIDLLWNSKCQSLTTSQFVYDNCAKRNFSNDLKFNDVTTIANNSIKYNNHIEITLTFNTSLAMQSSAARISITKSSTKFEIYSTNVNSWLVICSSHIKNWVLSSRMRQWNDNLWAIDNFKFTTKISFILFFDTKSINKYNVSITIFCFIINIIFYT